MRIAILEDDSDQLRMLTNWLEGCGYIVRGYATGRDFKREISRETFDLFILDWEIPDTSGTEVLTWLRANISLSAPVLFATVHDAEEDIVGALALGADDYMVKPLRRRETVARVGAMLRRANQKQPESKLSSPPYEIDTAHRKILLNGAPVHLSSTEFDLALTFFRNPGRVMSRSYLQELVWGNLELIATRTVDMYVSHIRKKLGMNQHSNYKIVAVPSRGYRLDRLTDRG